MTPPPKHKTVEKDGYVLTFYPGFLGSATVEVDGREDVLYRQQGVHDMRNQKGEPLPHFVLRLEGGPNRRDIALHVDDPEHAIAEIVVKLYPPHHEPGTGEGAPQAVEVLNARNDAILCPPYC